MSEYAMASDQELRPTQLLGYINSPPSKVAIYATSFPSWYLITSLREMSPGKFSEAGGKFYEFHKLNRSWRKTIRQMEARLANPKQTKSKKSSNVPILLALIAIVTTLGCASLLASLPTASERQQQAIQDDEHAELVKANSNALLIGDPYIGVPYWAGNQLDWPIDYSDPDGYFSVTATGAAICQITHRSYDHKWLYGECLTSYGVARKVTVAAKDVIFDPSN